MYKNSGYKNVRTAILMPTLCRHKHLEKCLESLKKNPWAKYVDLYIGVDYPTKDSHWPGYREILKLVERDYSMFRSFQVFKRPQNYGADKNLDVLYQEAIKDHEQFIFMEDDVEVSENYLEYMLKALEYFRDDPDVISVTGYSYPVKYRTEEKCTIITQNAIFNMWGAGFWKKKFDVARKEIEENLCLIRDYSYNLKHFHLSRYRRADYINYVAGVDPDDKDVRKLCFMFSSMTDIAMSVYIQVNRKYQAIPVISKVRNNGFDGTGLYCQAIKTSKSRRITSDNYDYSRQPIDYRKHFVLCYDEGKSRDTNFHILDRFIKPGKVMLLKSYMKLNADRILGKRKLKLVRIIHKYSSHH